MSCGLLEVVCLLISDRRRSVKRFEGDNNIRKSLFIVCDEHLSAFSRPALPRISRAGIKTMSLKLYDLVLKILRRWLLRDKFHCWIISSLLCVGFCVLKMLKIVVSPTETQVVSAVRQFLGIVSSFNEPTPQRAHQKLHQALEVY